VVFSLKGPHEIKHSDPCLEKMSTLSACREAVLCVAVPRELLWPVIESSVYDYECNTTTASPDATLVSSNTKSSGWASDDATLSTAQKIEALNHLVVVPADVLTAFSRSGLDEDEVKAQLRQWNHKLNVKRIASVRVSTETVEEYGTKLGSDVGLHTDESKQSFSSGYDDASSVGKRLESKYEVDLEMEGTLIKIDTTLRKDRMDVKGGAPAENVNDNVRELFDNGTHFQVSTFDLRQP